GWSRGVAPAEGGQVRQPGRGGGVRRDGAPHRAAGARGDPGRLGGPRAAGGWPPLIESEIVIVNRLGLHARAAAKFVHLASTFSSKVTVTKDGTRVDGKSILGLLTLAASKGVKLHLTVQGDDEADAAAKLTELI